MAIIKIPFDINGEPANETIEITNLSEAKKQAEDFVSFSKTAWDKYKLLYWEKVLDELNKL